ncbi:MAG: ABC transporter permease [Aeromicrobium sp.]|nr:MAG: ABC transporter permease [Aeromicrobium sp.]
MKRTLAVALRVAQQLSHDHRSMALIVVMPALLLSVFYWVYESRPDIFNHIGPALIGLFPFTIFFLITSVTMVRERTSGTLERLMTTPIRRGELIAGYTLALSIASFVQAVITTAVGVWLLGLDLAQPWGVLFLAVVSSIVGTALGLLASAFARTEFQAVQFMPLAIIPQFLLCGLLVPRDQMVAPLYWLSEMLPLSHLIDAFDIVTTESDVSSELLVKVGVQVIFALGFLTLASLTLPRKTA